VLRQQQYPLSQFMTAGIPIAEKMRVLREIIDGELPIYLCGKPLRTPRASFCAACGAPA
jgi:hypothetical protein